VPGLIGGKKAVADPGFGFQVDRGSGLFWQGSDVNAKVLPLIFGFRSPDLPKDVRVSKHTACVQREQAQQGVFGAGEINRHAIDADGARIEIDDEFSGFKDRNLA
jgi:hypothetical protein